MLSAIVLLLSVPTGDAVVRHGDFVLTTTRRVAGAVHSLKWKGREFIDSFDHGRQLQSAASFDCAKPGEFWAECFNPTEAGSRRDHTGPTSTSRLLALRTTNRTLETVTRMAFWLNPGEKSSDRPALNTAVLSDHFVRKRITLADGDPNRIGYEVTFTVPPGERHKLGQFEAVTGYMPASFNTFQTFDPVTGNLSPLTDGPGEQPLPVILSTADGKYAMGVRGDGKPGHGRFRFAAEKVVKWNCVYRVPDPAGEYTFKMKLAVGTREDVRRALR